MSSSIENSFIASLPNITNKVTPDDGVSDYFGTPINPFLPPGIVSTYVNDAINRLFTQPQTYPATLAGFKSALTANGYTQLVPQITFTGVFYDNAFQIMQDATSPSDAALLSTLGISQTTLFTNALNNFFQNLTPANLGGDANNYAANFVVYLDEYLTKTVNITDVATNPPLPSYQSLFTAFNGGTQANFQGAFASFYNQMVTKYGYFIPSQMLPQWIAQLSSASNPTAVINLGTGSEKTQIIFELLALVSQMINTLQDVSTAQVQRLSFYANWQQAYTTLISKIPVVTYSGLAGKVRTSGSSNTADTNSAIINATQAIGNINQTYTQTAQGFRDSVSDEAQSQQSAVDQSKQQLNAQASLATTLLQNLNTILQSIFSR